MEDFIYTKKNGDKIYCYGIASECLDGTYGLSIAYDYLDKKDKQRLSEHYNKQSKLLFPSLCEVLQKCPEVINCSISILDEQTYIPIHNGYYKGMLRFMLPIIIPKDVNNVFLCNNYEKYHWREGVGVLWDDTFPHKVFNNTDEIRIVLYMDVIRPMNGILDIMNKNLIHLLANSSMIKDEIKRTETKLKL